VTSSGLSSTEFAGRRGISLGVLAAVLLCAAAFFAFVFPQMPGRLGRPSVALIDDLAVWRWLVDVLPEPSTRSGVAAAVPLAACLAFAAYALAVLLAWRWQASVRSLVAIGAVAVVLTGVGVLALPNANTDIFSYIASGRVAAVHDANPYEHAPTAFPGDSVYPYVSEQYRGNLPSKLPAFMLLNVSLAELPGDDPVANLVTYRLAFFAFAVATFVLIVLAARRLFPGSEAGGLVLFGWNPVLTVYGQSKTDIVMVFLLVLAAYGYAVARERAGLVALGLSALVKLITLPLVLLTILRDLHLRRWRSVAVGGVLLVAVTALVYLPFSDSPSLVVDHLGLLGAVESDEGVNRSGDGAAERILRAGLGAGFVVLVVLLAVNQDASASRLVRAWAIAGLYFAVFLTTPSLAWYQLVPLALAAVAGSAAITVGMIALTFGSFLFSTWYAASSSAFPLGDLIGIPPTLVYLLPVTVGAIALVFLRGGLPGLARDVRQGR
jgi:hypothetical protein